MPQFRHIFLTESPSIRAFTSTSSGSTSSIPNRNRQEHSRHLLSRLNLAWQQAENEQAVAHAAREGVYIEFRSDPGAELVTKSLEDLRSKKVRLLNVRTKHENGEEVTYATVYVAHDQKNHFLKKIQEYAEKGSDERPKNARLINSIADIRKALIESFWQDSPELMPSDQKEWCEVWLSNDSDEVIQRFDTLLTQQAIEKAQGVIRFPERVVKLILASRTQLANLTALSDDIAEYRRAKETAAFWLDMDNEEQATWVQDLLRRCRVEANPGVAICVLDTGVNNGHPLLSPILRNEDCQAADARWGINDHHGHGTLMAGLAGYGDLREPLTHAKVIQLDHCLESVKILPPPPEETKPALWGYITDQAVSRAEIQAPQRKRILCMAVAAIDTRDQGRPSSWSGKLDQISAGSDNDIKRLFIVCAGNLKDLNVILNYTAAQESYSVHDPAQSWNALTVGAYTELNRIKNPTFRGYTPLAPMGALSPFSTTSLTWENKWPIKPEIVLEGGNLAHNGSGQGGEIDDLSLLSTFHDPSTRHFSNCNGTSAATAQAAHMAAKINSVYPDMWPETLRALLVHSAEWTDALKSQFLSASPTKTDYGRLLRFCGYGVPNLNQALYSASNNLTLIAQGELQPFSKRVAEEGSGYKTNEMHLYDLPWPKEVLVGLPPQVKVQMRVTLSYFIEPGPGEIGWKDRYRYASHGLRFDVKSPNETSDDFLKRINTAVREENEGHPGTQSASSHWLIGSTGRDKGSIHSDIWDGTAAELAESGVIAVYPVIGWWRERHYLNKWNRRARYSLVVSIRTPEEQVDIYTPVANKVGITIPVAIAM